jgi:hypothetical protein
LHRGPHRSGVRTFVKPRRSRCPRSSSGWNMRAHTLT